ncbi:hypothetical protein D3C81_1217860 [compost metagenome]
MAAGFLQHMEADAVACEVADQVRQVLLIADIARAGRVPEVHHTDRAGAGQLEGQAQLAAVEQGGLVVERAQVAGLEGGVGLPENGNANQ